MNRLNIEVTNQNHYNFNCLFALFANTFSDRYVSFIPVRLLILVKIPAGTFIQAGTCIRIPRVP